MIDKNSFKGLLDELDELLGKQSEFRELTIYGGAALIALNIVGRATIDIDVFQPHLDKVLQEAVIQIAKRNKLSEFWINSTGKAFIKELPAGWRQRVESVYKGKHLVVNSLGRRDLVFTKLLAELDRQEDMADILALAPTTEELQFSEEQLLKLDNKIIWQNKVKELIASLKAK
jgi:hypothetical protein